MKNLSYDEMIINFIKNAKIYGFYQLNPQIAKGDDWYKVSDDAVKVMSKIERKLIKEPIEMHKFIDELYQNEDFCVRHAIYSFSIRVDYRKKESINNLVIIANDKTCQYGIFSESTKLALKWLGIL